MALETGFAVHDSQVLNSITPLTPKGAKGMQETSDSELSNQPAIDMLQPCRPSHHKGMLSLSCQPWLSASLRGLASSISACSSNSSGVRGTTAGDSPLSSLASASVHAIVRPRHRGHARAVAICNAGASRHGCATVSPAVDVVFFFLILPL